MWSRQLQLLFPTFLVNFHSQLNQGTDNHQFDFSQPTLKQAFNHFPLLFWQKCAEWPTFANFSCRPRDWCRIRTLRARLANNARVHFASSFSQNCCGYLATSATIQIENFMLELGMTTRCDNNKIISSNLAKSISSLHYFTSCSGTCLHNNPSNITSGLFVTLIRLLPNPNTFNILLQDNIVWSTHLKNWRKIL